MANTVELFFNGLSPAVKFGFKPINLEWTVLELKEFISEWIPGEISASHIILRVVKWDLEDDKTVEFYSTIGRLPAMQSVQVLKKHPDSSCEVCKKFDVSNEGKQPENNKDKGSSLRIVTKKIKRIAQDIKNMKIGLH